MLSDTKVKKIVDFESSSDVFPGPDKGVYIFYGIGIMMENVK